MGSEYGWDTDKILSLPVCEVNWRLGAIYKRQRQSLIFEASVHGLEINDALLQDAEPIKLSKEQQELIERRKQEALERIRARHLRDG